MMIPVLLGISLLIFAIISATPGNPGRLILGERATAEAVQEMNESLGYYDPLAVRYINYMRGLLRGDLGTSWRTGMGVAASIGERFPTTLLLATMDIVLTAAMSIPLGVLVAVKKESLLDNVMTVLALVFTAMPSFWLGLILMLIFALTLHLLPATGSDRFVNFILPALAMSLLSVAQIMRMTRSSMLEVIRTDYVRTARAKGLSESKIIWRHAVRNALLPVVTTMGNNFGWSLGGSVITETVFGMTGVGTLLLAAVRSKDVPLVMGCVLFMSFIFSIVTLIVDISYSFIDPRIKAQYSGRKG